METWLTTDTHFNHNMLVDIEERPENFEHTIVKKWKEVVKENDLVIHLGDVCFGGVEMWAHYISRLPGNKVLVLGNHDKASYHWYMTHGFCFACDEFVWDYGGYNILFTHEPCDEEYLREYGLVNVHGHTHGGKHRTLGNVNPDLYYSLSLENTAYGMTKIKTVVQSFGKRRRNNPMPIRRL